MVMRVLVLVVLLVVVCGLAAGAVVPKGARVLGVDVGMAEKGDFGAAFALAKKAGVEDVGLSLDWPDLETSPGKYDLKWIEIANAYYPAAGVSVTLTIRPLHTNRSRLPADLEGRRLDDPVVIDRFNQLLAHVFQASPKMKISSLSIGSESDIFLGQDKGLWRSFAVFVAKTSARAKELRPGLKVSAEMTYNGLTGPMRAQAAEVNKHADVIAVSHYPLKPDFSVQQPEVVGRIFDTICKLYPGRPIYFLQWGYPSSAELGSSQELQAKFIRETFKAWDKHSKQIKLVDFTWLHDYSPDSLKTTQAYYGITDRKFSEFISSLGLRTWPGTGTDKLAYKALCGEAKGRGW